MSVPRNLALLTALCCASSFSAADQAINQFELKDLEVEVGQWEFQSQNAHVWGHPRRKFLEEQPGEFEYDDNALGQQRHAVEMEYGATAWMRNRIGIEFEKERLDDPPTFSMRDDFSALVLDEIAAEVVVVFVPTDARPQGQGWDIGWGLGMLIEYQYLVDPDEADSIVVGPIIELDWRRWNIVVNPTLVQFFGGEGDDEKLDFTYAAHLLFDASSSWDVGVELYGTIDRLGNTGTPPEEVQLFGDHDLIRLGPIAYCKHAFGFDAGDDPQTLVVGVGLFFGLNEATPDYSFKWSVEFEF
jgi:hypothetical protein